MRATIKHNKKDHRFKPPAHSPNVSPSVQVTLRLSQDLYERITATYTEPRATRSAAFVAAFEASLTFPLVASLFERALTGLYEEDTAKRAKLRYQLEKELRQLVFKRPGVAR